MKISIPLALAAGFAVVSFSSPAADWPNWRGPDHNGISKETDWSTQWPAAGPKQLWKAKVGTGFSSFAVSGGKVFTVGNTDNTDTVFCFDANTGAEVWKQSYASPLDPKYYEGGPNATPTVEGERIYTFSKRGVAHCLDAAEGTELWVKDLAAELKAKMPVWGFAGSVLIAGELALLNVGSTGAALDKKTGKVIWSSGPEEAGYSSLVPVEIGAKSAVAFASKQHVVAVTVADGKELWRFPWKTQYNVNPTDPIFSGSKVFISSGYNRGGGVFDVSASPPKNLWDNKNMRNHMNSCVLWQGHLYGLDDNQLRCLVFDTGAVKWTDKAAGKGSLMLADGKLIVLSEKGELLVAAPSPDGFKPLVRAQVLGGKCWTVPVLANGKIYCRNAAGDVVCVDVSGK
ncbi:MAG: alcohol dehydrogenase [Pedosphaera sp.]|nr:alcohol dehydrogenase [Pedosphaera sp.]